MCIVAKKISFAICIASVCFIYFHQMAETLFQYQQVSQVIGEMHKIVIFLLLVNIIFICYSFAMLDLCLLTARVLTQTLPI